MNVPLVQVIDLKRHFRLPGEWLSRKRAFVSAVDGVSLELLQGEVLGLVGESGCGKTTLGRLLLRLIEPSAGQVIFDGEDITRLKGEALRHLRPQMQIVFQNPLSSLSPRLRIEDVVAEPLHTHHALPQDQVRGRVIDLLEQVGLGSQHLERYAHELSGGQCQRVAIARALALHPRLIVLDEPTSALDVSVQAQILNLLQDLQEAQGLTYLFISHDLNVVQHVSDRIGVMYLGKLVELGQAETIFTAPLHPYTQALFEAIPLPVMDQAHELKVLEGNVPSPVNPPPGCRFHTRCPLAQGICQEQEPLLREVQSRHLVACHLVQGENP